MPTINSNKRAAPRHISRIATSSRVPASDAQRTGEKSKKLTQTSFTTLQRQRAEELHDEDPKKYPAPQQGMSSSELNTATPAMKKQASEEAKAN